MSWIDRLLDWNRGSRSRLGAVAIQVACDEMQNRKLANHHSHRVKECSTSWSRTASTSREENSLSASSRPIAPLAALADLAVRSFSLRTCSSRSLRLAAAFAALSTFVIPEEDSPSVARWLVKRDSRREEDGTASYRGSETKRVLICKVQTNDQSKQAREE